MAKARKIGRSAVSGRYTTVAKARRYSTTHVVETVKGKKRSK